MSFASSVLHVGRENELLLPAGPKAAYVQLRPAIASRSDGRPFGNALALRLERHVLFLAIIRPKHDLVNHERDVRFEALERACLQAEPRLQALSHQLGRQVLNALLLDQLTHHLAGETRDIGFAVRAVDLGPCGVPCVSGDRKCGGRGDLPNS